MSTAVDLHIEEYGAGEPAIVLMHGFAGSARNLRPQARFLADRHRVILFDARGHARSAAQTIPPSTNRSRSSKTCAHGRTHSDQARCRGRHQHGCRDRASLCASISGVDRRTRARVVSQLRQRIIVGARDRRRDRGGGSRGSGSGSSGAADDTTRSRRSGSDKGSSSTTRARFRRAPPRARAAAVVERAEALRALTVPTLVIAGERDIRRSNRRAPSSRCCRTSAFVIPDAGHVVNLENPESFNEALSNFLSEIEATEMNAAIARKEPGVGRVRLRAFEGHCPQRRTGRRASTSSAPPQHHVLTRDTRWQYMCCMPAR